MYNAFGFSLSKLSDLKLRFMTGIYSEKSNPKRCKLWNSKFS